MTDARDRIHVIDSHTGGEPTRIVIGGGPALGEGSMQDRLARFRSTYDEVRSAVVCEPRGADAIVGALLCEPVDPACAAGVIFFNNVGFLGMCGHGTIGLAATLAYLGRIRPGVHRVETPVGVVTLELHPNGEATVENVASYRLAKHVEVSVPGAGTVTGDIAWGGNWFFLTEARPCELELRNLETLTTYTGSIRAALQTHGITGANGQEIDHIELFAAPRAPGLDSRNFVLCPGKSYDRSPCGTGTSAKVACLAADGKLREGEIWRQESIIGSVFEASFSSRGGAVYPRIRGSAFVTADSHLILQDNDPYRAGIRA